VPLCEKNCASNADCTSPGGQCLDSVSGSAPYNLCTVNCNLRTSAGCPTGDACRIASTSTGGLTYCGGSGTGQQGAYCDYDSDCGSGYYCYIDTLYQECEKLCTSNADCPSGLMTCYKGITVGGVTWGVCDY
jgi:hypothetical protein